MASLFIKDLKTAALAREIAARLGTTNTEAVNRGLRALEGYVAAPAVAGSTVDWLRTYRAARPLPDMEAMKIDKAFFDALSDEEDVVDSGDVEP